MTNNNAPPQPTESNSNNEKKDAKLKRTRKCRFIGFSEQLEEKRKAREDKPGTWLEIKLVVPFMFAMAGYAWYVYIGRFCVPMLRREEGAMGGRGMGVAFTIVYCLFGLMFWWAYIKLILTPPGFAKDYVQNTPAPQIDYPRGHGRTQPSASRRGYEYDTEDWDSDEDFIGGAPYAEISPPTSGPSINEGSSSQWPAVDLEKQAGINVPTTPHRPPAPVARTDEMSRRKPSDSRSPLNVADAREQIHTRSLSSGERNTDETAVAASGETNKEGAHLHPLTKEAAQVIPPNAHEQRLPPPSSARSVEEGLPPPQYSRRPPTHPVLLPEFRYCYKDGLVKPMRAHHCRICGTCVLMYDHHCPWIGGCVGARNHKFFVNFLQWSTLWLYWIFATLIGLTAKSASNSSSDIDPQIIVAIALSGFFSIFTTVLLLAHIHMTNLNQTTVESVGISHMREREGAMLGQMVPLWEWRRRNKIRKEWDTEWGKLSTEGNIWWLGSVRANWENRMGRNRWGWFLPIGKSEGDGLTYPTNPRFDADGRWRRRSEWPAELR